MSALPVTMLALWRRQWSGGAVRANWMPPATHPSSRVVGCRGRADRHGLLRMTSRVRIGVIGVGIFGQRHLSAYAHQAVELVGLADRDRERARSVAERFGIDRWFGDGVELIEECRPDGLS